MLFRLERYEFLRIISMSFDRSRFNVTIERNCNIRGERARLSANDIIYVITVHSVFSFFLFIEILKYFNTRVCIILSFAKRNTIRNERHTIDVDVQRRPITFFARFFCIY